MSLQLATRVLSLPMHAYLDEDTQQMVMAEVRTVVEGG